MSGSWRSWLERVGLLVAGVVLGAVMDARHVIDGIRLSEVDWTAIGTLLVALATILLAWQTRATVQGIRADREERRQAFVVAYAEVHGSDIAVVVENRGPGPAFDVRVSPADQGLWLDRKPHVGDPPLPMAIGYLSGGAKLPRTVDAWGIGDSSMYPAVRVRTTWLDERQVEHVSESLIDPGPWLSWRPKDPLEAIADAIKGISR